MKLVLEYEQLYSEQLRLDKHRVLVRPQRFERCVLHWRDGLVDNAGATWLVPFSLYPRSVILRRGET